MTTVKIYAGTGRDVGRAIIDEGHRRGMFVTAHLGRYSAQDAVADGIDGLEHIWSVFNYVIPPQVRPARASRHARSRQSRCARRWWPSWPARKTYVDPTLVVFRNMILLPRRERGPRSPRQRPGAAAAAEFWPVYLKRSGCPAGRRAGGSPPRVGQVPGVDRQAVSSRRAAVGRHRLARAASDAGLFAAPGAGAAGRIGPAAGGRPASRDAAPTRPCWGKRIDLGSIAPGKLADMVLLIGQPAGRHPPHAADRDGDSRRQRLPPGQKCSNEHPAIDNHNDLAHALSKRQCRGLRGTKRGLIDGVQGTGADTGPMPAEASSCRFRARMPRPGCTGEPA